MTTEEYNAIAESILKGEWRKGDIEWIGKIEVMLEEYEEDNPAGGSLHIVLDDGNLGDNSVSFCYGYASAKEDNLGVHIAFLMELMNIKQRIITWKIWNCTYDNTETA